MNFQQFFDPTKATPFQTKAWGKFQALGLPHRKLEAWKYINANKFFELNFDVGQVMMPQEYTKYSDLLEFNFTQLENESLYHLALSSGPTHQYVITNDGEYDLSPIINPGIGSDSYYQSRHQIIIKKHVKAQIKCTWQSPEHGHHAMINALTEIVVEEGASLDLWQTNDFGKNNFIYNLTLANLKKDSILRVHSYNIDNELSRSMLFADLQGPGANCEAYGLYCAREKNVCDTQTYIKHSSADTTSLQHFKGLAADDSRCIFSGGIRIEKNAQRVQSKQMNKNLLLSKKAHAISIPQLEIYADDVKAAHGSTTGQINQDEIFYFKSRGINEAKAQMMLGHAFANELILKLPNKKWQKQCSDLLFDRFEKFTTLKGVHHE